MKANIILFAEKSREQLIQDILDREKKIQEQEQQIRDLEKQLGKKNALDEHRQFLRLDRLAKRSLRPRTPGQKTGHVGLTREKPSRMDRVVEQTLKKCPDCDHKLSASQEVIEHIQEDIVPAQVQVTCYRKHRYYCKHCQEMKTAAYASEEIPYGYLGPNILIQASILKYSHGLPFNKIKEVFEGLCGLKVTEGALAKCLQRMSEWLKVEEDEILKAIRGSPHTHMDETGWKVNGAKNWLWAAVNKMLAYYRVAASRGARVAKEIVGENYQGIICADFYAAYNRVGGKKQRCLVHLLRTMREYRARDDSAEFIKHEKRLKRIVNDAIRLQDRHNRLNSQIYKRRVKQIKRRLFAWSCGDYENENLKRLSKRFLKYWTQMLTFLDHPEISYHNNLAERMIRPNVIIRNRSFQNRSQAGADAHGTHMSLIQTLRLQKRNIAEEMKRAYLSHRQGNIAPILNFTSAR